MLCLKTLSQLEPFLLVLMRLSIQHNSCILIVLLSFYFHFLVCSKAVAPPAATITTTTTPTGVVLSRLPQQRYKQPIAPSLSQILIQSLSRRSSTMSDPNDKSSTVLRELKETIRTQAAQIDALQQQLKDFKSSSSSSSSSRKHSSTAIATTIQHGGGGSHSSGNNNIALEEMIQYQHRPFYSIASQRVLWLGLFMISLSWTAIIMSEFEHVLTQQVELAFFVPFLAGHGGNTGGQTVGTVLSALSAGVITLHDAPKIIVKEAMSGLCMGIILGSIVGPLAHYGMGISQHVSTVIWCTLPLVSTIAATLGSTIPFACLALGLNPSVIAAPAMTSLVDVSGLLSYFLIASRIFKAFGIHLKK
jgi:cation transporter-like permease